MTASRSATLFHFTEDIDTVKSILHNGFFPHYCRENMSWLWPNKGFWSFPMVCFCDIPLGRISKHVDDYGHYGLGLSKDWAINNGLNPITYLSKGSPLSNAFLNAYCGIMDVQKKSPNNKIPESVFTMLGYVKAASGTTPDSSKLKDFYIENEWRFTPKQGTLPCHTGNTDTPDELNNLAKNDALKFEPKDVRYIFVKEDADILPLFDYIQFDLKSCHADDRKILSSRVISLEHLKKDI
jgi:hypothetical protein